CCTRLRVRPMPADRRLDTRMELGSRNSFREEDMKFVVIGQPSGATIDQIMAVYPRHKALVDQLIDRGDVIGIGPFADLGNRVIFRPREAQETFMRQDPFFLEGLVKSYVLHEWRDSLLS